MYLLKNMRICSSGGYRLHPLFLLGCSIFGLGVAIIISDIVELTL